MVDLRKEIPEKGTVNKRSEAGEVQVRCDVHDAGKTKFYMSLSLARSDIYRLNIANIVCYRRPGKY